jgi:hypothetical protein
MGKGYVESSMSKSHLFFEWGLLTGLTFSYIVYAPPRKCPFAKKGRI